MNVHLWPGAAVYAVKLVISAKVGSGRVAVSETEAPGILANLV
jgi:hypothetical protein